jgi:arylesterase / paraoxonase
MRTFLVILAAVIALVVWRGFEFVSTAGLLRDLEPKMAGSCTIVPGVVGAEDHTIDAETGLVYLSGYDRRIVVAGGQPTPGAIWSYDLNDPDAKPVNLTPNAGADFLPHGISLYIGEDGMRRLFVINHGKDEQSVDIFDVTPLGLLKVKSVSGELLRTPNDLVAVSPEAFYFSNDHRYLQDDAMRPFEDFLGLPLTDAGYFDGENFTVAIENVAGANGINVSADGSTLYLSAARGSVVYVYDRGIESGDLTYRQSIDLPGLPDNIELLDDGNLLVALHSKVLTMLAHFGDEAVDAPSHIVEVDPESGAVETIFLSLGEDISAASTGARLGDRLIIGAIFDEKFLDCDLSANN